VAATSTFRYVRIVLNPSLPHAQLVATLAHELQHVSEIGNEPSVVDPRSLSSFYGRVGTEHGFHSEEWETKLAQDTGYIVIRELASNRADARGF